MNDNLKFSLHDFSGVPSPDQRLDILQTLLSDIDHSLSSKEIQTLAMATHGFVAADLAALCNEAAMTALRRYIKFGSSDKYAGALSSLLAELSVSVKRDLSSSANGSGNQRRL